MNYKDFTLGDWICHISGVIEDESELDGNEMRDLVEFLSRLPKWISVSERLPKEHGEYLITWTTSRSKRPFIGVSEGEVTSEYDHEHNRFKFEWLLEDYIKAYPNVEVIAWMPLPKPYKANFDK